MAAARVGLAGVVVTMGVEGFLSPLPPAMLLVVPAVIQFSSPEEIGRRKWRLTQEW